SSDVCSSDLHDSDGADRQETHRGAVAQHGEDQGGGERGHHPQRQGLTTKESQHLHTSDTESRPELPTDSDPCRSGGRTARRCGSSGMSTRALSTFSSGPRREGAIQTFHCIFLFVAGGFSRNDTLMC